MLHGYEICEFHKFPKTTECITEDTLLSSLTAFACDGIMDAATGRFNMRENFKMLLNYHQIQLIVHVNVLLKGIVL